VQGRLRGEDLRVQIDTECGHCARRFGLTVDHNLHVTGQTESCAPLIFEPEIDWASFKAPTIIRDY